MTKLPQSHLKELDLLKAVINNNPDQTYLIDESGIVLDVFSGRERVMFFEHQRLIGSHFSKHFSPSLCNIIEVVVDEILTDCSSQLITYTIHPADIINQNIEYEGDTIFTYEARISPIKLESFGQRLVMWTARDITKRVKLEKEINYLLEHDELTGVLNRRKLMAHLSKAYDAFKIYSSNVSIIITDIDNFKECNDTFGHFSGDEVIKHVAQVCSKYLRKCDYIGRLGGEEFAILLPNTTLEQAVKVAKRLCHLVAETPCALESNIQIETTVSMGVSQFQKGDTSINDALTRADKAMYFSKRHGKNRVSHKLI